jgi:hypothetical protein
VKVVISEFQINRVGTSVVHYGFTESTLMRNLGLQRLHQLTNFRLTIPAFQVRQKTSILYHLLDTKEFVWYPSPINLEP